MAACQHKFIIYGAINGAAERMSNPSNSSVRIGVIIAVIFRADLRLPQSGSLFIL